MPPYAADLRRLCDLQAGERYVYGAEVHLDDPNPPGPWDCSELLQWATSRLGVPLPDGSRNQLDECTRRGTLIPIQRAIETEATLLFGQTSTWHHVALSRGDGTTIEARGARYGVGHWGASSRGWTHAAYVPGIDYAPPTGPPAPAPPGPTVTAPAPAFDHPHLVAGSRAIRANHYSCAWVQHWQRRMVERGWRITPDGDYGAGSRAVCIAFQRDKGLAADGILGPMTWVAAWSAPVT